MTKSPFKWPGGGRRPKFGSVAVEIDGRRFASKREGIRYVALSLLLRAGKISDLKIQPRYQLVVNGVAVATYIADFEYLDNESGRLVVEDVKSAPTRTPVYLIKKKLMKALHGVDIVEVP